MADSQSIPVALTAQILLDAILACRYDGGYVHVATIEYDDDGDEVGIQGFASVTLDLVLDLEQMADMLNSLLDRGAGRG